MEILDETMNVLLTIPADTVHIICDAKVVQDDQVCKASARYTVRDIHNAFRDFYACQEGYYLDHLEMGSDEAAEYPVILQVPEETYSLDINCLSVGLEDLSEKTGGLVDSGFVWHDNIRHLKRADVEKSRNDFLKYIPYGDHYNDVYRLADGGLEEPGKMRTLTEADFGESPKEGDGT